MCSANAASKIKVFSFECVGLQVWVEWAVNAKLPIALLERRWRQQTAAHAPDTRQVCSNFAKTDFLEVCKSFNYVMACRLIS